MLIARCGFHLPRWCGIVAFANWLLKSCRLRHTSGWSTCSETPGGTGALGLAVEKTAAQADSNNGRLNCRAQHSRPRRHRPSGDAAALPRSRHRRRNSPGAAKISLPSEFTAGAMWGTRGSSQRGPLAEGALLIGPFRVRPDAGCTAQAIFEVRLCNGGLHPRTAGRSEGLPGSETVLR